jgi:hypothetical protein
MKNKILKDLINIFTSLGFGHEKRITPIGFTSGRNIPIAQFRLFIPNDSGYEESGDMWEYNIINISDEFIRVESAGVTRADKRYLYVNMDYMLDISDGYGSVWSMLSKRPYLNEKIREIKLNQILS